MTAPGCANRFVIGQARRERWGASLRSLCGEGRPNIMDETACAVGVWQMLSPIGSIRRRAPPAKVWTTLPVALFLGLGIYSHAAAAYARPMSEVADFVNHGAAYITPAVVGNVMRELPLWKVEFTQINAPKFPHLVDQLEFLADVVEDVAENAYKELSYTAFSRAVFALMYVHKKVNIIPDTIPNFGRADDSSVVRTVLLQNELAFAKYAASQKMDWAQITSKP